MIFDRFNKKINEKMNMLRTFGAGTGAKAIQTELKRIENKCLRIAQTIEEETVGNQEIKNLNWLLNKKFKKHEKGEDAEMKQKTGEILQRLLEKEYRASDATFLKGEYLEFWGRVARKDINEMMKKLGLRLHF